MEKKLNNCKRARTYTHKHTDPRTHARMRANTQNKNCLFQLSSASAISLIDLLMPLIQEVMGLPIFHWYQRHYIFGTLSSVILCKCPYQINCFSLMHCIIIVFVTPNRSYILSFRILSSFGFLYAPLKVFFYVISIFVFLCSFSLHVSDSYKIYVIFKYIYETISICLPLQFTKMYKNNVLNFLYFVKN